MVTQRRHLSADFVGRESWSTWPRYEAATEGFRNYWYPVMWSRELSNGKPRTLKLLGEQIMFYREDGKVYALRDRCPHRGVPLSAGTQEFPGTFSCPYHGWTFDLASGELRAAITDGPDSPICGKVAVRSYPVEERLGMIWAFIGEIDAVPIEEDIPEELLSTPRMTLGGRITERPANWRIGTENGYDEGHAKYLHRFSWMMILRRARMPAWNRTHVESSADGKWATRVQDEMHFDADYPGLGKWPRKQWWQRSERRGTSSKQDADEVIKAMDAPGTASIRMPCTLRILMNPTWVHYDWCVPVDAENYRYVQIAVRFKGGRAGMRFKALYWGFLRWAFHGQFTGQDEWMVSVTDAPPERLYRPDVSIIAWRNLCERARGTELPAQPERELRDDVVEAMHEAASA